MASVCPVTFIFLLLLVGCCARPLYPLPSIRNNISKQPSQHFRPFNIAHRGSNGEFPEETAAAYMRAIEEGADFIETDILASKDGVLICFHDLMLDDTTDVAQRKEFESQKRMHEVQGVNMTGYFTIDFTLEELKSLGVKQRFSFRYQQYNGKYSIITFEEFISIALNAPRLVGIYPEIKNPLFINQHVKWPGGKKFEDMFVDTLKKYRYGGTYMSKQWLKQPAFVQSFAPTSLIYVSNLTDLPKVLLIADATAPTQDTNQKSLPTVTLTSSNTTSWALGLGRIQLFLYQAIICKHLLILLPEHMLITFSFYPHEVFIYCRLNPSRCTHTLSGTRTPYI